MMQRKYYRFAGLEFSVEMPEAICYTDDQRLSEFRVEAVSAPHRFCFGFADEFSEPQGTLLSGGPNIRIYAADDKRIRDIGGSLPYIRVEHQEREHSVLARRNAYSGTIGVKTVLESMGVEHLIARNHGFVFHCACVEYRGKAILFTAPSETGKSTQAELWRRYRGAEIINGDRAAVRLSEGTLLAEGIPFSGSSSYCKNRSLPLSAIVYLAQAPKTTIRKLRGYEAFSKIWEGISVNTWDRQDMELVSALVQKTAAEIPVFYMPCTPDADAVRILEEMLKKEEIL